MLEPKNIVLKPKQVFGTLLGTQKHGFGSKKTCLEPRGVAQELQPTPPTSKSIFLKGTGAVLEPRGIARNPKTWFWSQKTCFGIQKHCLDPKTWFWKQKTCFGNLLGTHKRGFGCKKADLEWRGVVLELQPPPNPQIRIYGPGEGQKGRRRPSNPDLKVWGGRQGGGDPQIRIYGFGNSGIPGPLLSPLSGNPQIRI